ncbi:hypothetical protein V8E53_013188 [Lactarius tabidus]
MPPRHPQTTRASDTTKTFAERDVLFKERALKRAERAEARRVKAEEHKEAGNVHFLKGEYREAIAEYEVAIHIHGPSATYLSNMAAAWLKLKAYDAAEQCASRALALDPQFHKARFRRGQARRGNLQLALARIDFATFLEKNPDSTEAGKALYEIVILLRERNEGDESVKPVDCRPFLNDAKYELESVSDSSDWNHEGDGSPCSNYNLDGCMRGAECEFSHGPDYKSVRDRLGRNVCVNFLVGSCSGECACSHDNTYLPSGRWWASEKKRAEVRDWLNRYSRDVFEPRPVLLPQLLALIDARVAWTPKHTAKVEEAHVWRGHVMMLEGFGEDADDLEYADYVTKGRHGPRPNCGRCLQCLGPEKFEALRRA